MELVKSYATVTVRSDIQESPDHRALTSGNAEVDVDHGSKRSQLETLNQRLQGPSTWV